MEGEPDLPAPPPPESQVFEPNSSRPINIYPDSVNISRPASTSATSSPSSSAPDMVRHMQAAFKRHRPLGTMQSNGLKPRRCLVPQQETAENESNLPHEVNSKPSPQKNQPLSIRSGINDAVASAGAEPINAVAGVQKKVQFLSENIAPSQGANDRMSTGTDDLLSHMNSLALTETDWDEGSQVDTSAAAKQEWLHHKFQSAEINSNNLIRSEGNVASSVLARRNLGVQDQFHQFESFLQSNMNSAMIQSSVAGISSANSTLINLASAPMISSTTYSSQHQTGVVQPPSSLSKHAGGLPSHDSHQLSMAPQPISSNADIPMEVDKSSGPSKDHDIAKDSCHEENNLVKENVMEIKSQPPSSSVPTSDVKLGKSKLEKLEKGGDGGGGKAASTSRRRGYDPDLFFKVNGKFYQRLGKIGSGGSSEVHKVISSDCMIYALKKIKLKGRDYATAYGFCQEIEYLNRLKGKSNVIQLVDYEVTDKTLHQEVMNGSMCSKDGKVKDDGYIYMVLEYGEIDLANMLSQKWNELEGSNTIIDENWLRFYWQQILLAVNTIHAERIVHSDLKPANFLLVRGSLKLIDFGIAKAIMCDTTNIQRDSQVGTLSYMSPEAFLCNETDSNGNTIKCGRSSDIWSLGCILYQMVYGRTPFSEYKTFWAKFKVITDPSHKIVYEPLPNPWLLDLMKKCLAWDRNERWRIPQLLQHPFLVPPIPSNLISPVKEKHTLFQSIAESSADDQKALMLCNELQSMVIRPSSEVESGSLISREELGKLLCKISEACVQLREELTGL